MLGLEIYERLLGVGRVNAEIFTLRKSKRPGDQRTAASRVWRWVLKNALHQAQRRCFWPRWCRRSARLVAKNIIISLIGAVICSIFPTKIGFCPKHNQNLNIPALLFWRRRKAEQMNEYDFAFGRRERSRFGCFWLGFWFWLFFGFLIEFLMCKVYGNKSYQIRIMIKWILQVLY